MKNIFKGIKCLVLFIKSKLTIMKYANYYIQSIENQKKIFDLIERYIDIFTQHTPGYVSKDDRKDNSLDIIVGPEKFTILSSIEAFGDITFKVFSWKFDLSSLTRYSHMEIDKLCFIKSGNSLNFKYPHVLDSGEDYYQILSLSGELNFKSIEPLFNVIEDYVFHKDKYSQQNAI